VSASSIKSDNDEFKSKIDQVRSQVFRFWDKNTVSEGHDFYFYFMFKTNFYGHNKICGSQKNLGAVPQMHPVATGLKNTSTSRTNQHAVAWNQCSITILWTQPPGLEMLSCILCIEWENSTACENYMFFRPNNATSQSFEKLQRLPLLFRQCNLALGGSFPLYAQ